MQYLLELGATIEDLRGSADFLPPLAGTLALLPARERLTLADVAERAGTDLETAARMWMAGGLPRPGPDDRVCTEGDVEVLQTFLAGRELLGEAVTFQLARVVGSAVARIADAARSMFLVNLAAPKLAEDPVGLALARANTEAAALVPGLSHSVDMLLRHHFELERRPILAGMTRGYDGQDLTVGFVDLVGSTELAQQLSIGEFGAAIGDFETAAAETVAAAGGRLVKLIGDEAMFVVADAGAACEIALGIIERVASHPVLPPARGGLAAGEILTREGDYFGPVVNLAARAVKVAEPGHVVVSGDVSRAVAARRFRSIGEQTLRGFDAPVELFRLEPAP